MIGGSFAACPSLGFRSVLAWPDPAGVRGGDANAESRGLLCVDWKLAEVGVGSLVD